MTGNRDLQFPLPRELISIGVEAGTLVGVINCEEKLAASLQGMKPGEPITSREVGGGGALAVEGHQ